jgi:hypothetical protein
LHNLGKISTWLIDSERYPITYLQHSYIPRIPQKLPARRKLCSRRNNSSHCLVLKWDFACIYYRTTIPFTDTSSLLPLFMRSILHLWVYVSYITQVLDQLVPVLVRNYIPGQSRQVGCLAGRLTGHPVVGRQVIGN